MKMTVTNLSRLVYIIINHSNFTNVIQKYNNNTFVIWYFCVAASTTRGKPSTIEQQQRSHAMITLCCLDLPGITLYTFQLASIFICGAFLFIRWLTCIRHCIIFLGISTCNGTCTITILSYWVTETDKFVKKLHQVYHDTTSKVSGSGAAKRDAACAPHRGALESRRPMNLKSRNWNGQLRIKFLYNFICTILYKLIE